MTIQKLRGDEMNRLSPDEFKAAKKFPIYVLLQNIRSMWNVGSIFRTCDATRIEKIIITGYTATPPRKEIDKTALGATEWVAWDYVPNPLDAIARLKAQGVTIAALEIAANARPYDSLSQRHFPLCLVVGNEVTGIDDEALAECDLALEIPQYGVKHSLNVAVAVGVALFELVKATTRVD